MKWLLNFKKETCTRRNLKQAKPHKLKASRNLELSPLFFFLLIFLSLMQVGLSIPFKRNEYAFLRMIQYQLNEITIKIEGTGENTKATVEFRNSGTKQLLLKFARFTVIG